LVPENLALVTDDALDGFGQLADGDFCAGTDVDELLLAVVLHEEEASPRQVIGAEELAQGGAGAPAHDAGSARGLGVVKPANHGGQDMGAERVVIVI